MTNAGEKKDKAVRLSDLARSFRFADIYAFGSRPAEIAAMIINGEALQCASSSDVDIGIRPKQGPKPSTKDLVKLTVVYLPRVLLKALEATYHFVSQGGRSNKFTWNENHRNPYDRGLNDRMRHKGWGGPV